MKTETLANAALKLALEALTNAIAVRNGEGGTKLVSPLEENAITAIEEALAQDETSDSSLSRQAKRSSRAAQQEPVAWMDIDEKGSASGLRYWSEPDNRHEVALYILKEKNT